MIREGLFVLNAQKSTPALKKGLFCLKYQNIYKPLSKNRIQMFRLKRKKKQKCELNFFTFHNERLTLELLEVINM